MGIHFLSQGRGLVFDPQGGCIPPLPPPPLPMWGGVPDIPAPGGVGEVYRAKKIGRKFLICRGGVERG